MRRALLTTLVFLALLAPHAAHSESWYCSADPETLKGLKVKAKVMIRYLDPATGKNVKMSYKPDTVEFWMDKDVDGATDTYVVMSGGGLGEVAASMHGSITRLGSTSYVSGCINVEHESLSFSYFDDFNSIDSEGVAAMSVEGVFKDLMVSKEPSGDVRIKFIYNIVGTTAEGYNAFIRMTLSAVALGEDTI